MTGMLDGMGAVVRHRLLLVAVPLLVGLAGTAAASAYPLAEVPGSVKAGPHGLAFLHPVTLDFHPSLSWGPGRRDVVLTLRPRRSCTVHVTRISSTGPGRIEVQASEQGQPCTGPRRTQHVTLPLPTVPDPERGVWLNIGPKTLHLWWKKPHVTHGR